MQPTVATLVKQQVSVSLPAVAYRKPEASPGIHGSTAQATMCGREKEQSDVGMEKSSVRKWLGA